MKIVRLLLLAGHFAGLPSAKAQEPLEFSQISISGDQLNLVWDGGEPPFSVELSDDLTSWTPFLQTPESSATIAVGDRPDQFFRVAELGEVAGTHLGQLRVDEGEFGTPLARHRLKSLWDFYLPDGVGRSGVPREFFQKLTLRVVYREGDERRLFTGKLADLPGASLSTAARNITVNWTLGEGEDRRDLMLELDFRYDIATPRGEIHLSDPQYTLTCRYATPQPEAGWDGGLVMVSSREDEVSLYQLADQRQPAWYLRDVAFQVGGVGFELDYQLGVPMLEGDPAFIWKTPILDSWEDVTTITGLTSRPLEIPDRFTQTYQPGHHNFVETFWIEPALIPGLDEATREELRAADIRFIAVTNPFAFPESDPSCQLVGFDLQVRDL